MAEFFLAIPALAQQDYPNRPIRLIAAASQGGTLDILARIFGARLSDVFKQQVVVDNRASASGVIAREITANAPADGHTLLLSFHQHTISAALNYKLPYHTVTSFTPVTQLTSAAQLLVVAPHRRRVTSVNSLPGPKILLVRSNIDRRASPPAGT